MRALEVATAPKLTASLARALLGVVAPLVATALVLRFLVPSGGAGLRGVVASAAHDHPLAFGVGWFLVFSATAHYWIGGRVEASRGLVVGVVVAAAGAFAIRTYVARPYRVASASMLPTFEPDDLVACSPRSFTPDRGDVVVFDSSAVAMSARDGAGVPDVLVKRVIGLPGDTIAMNGGAPIINGWQVPMCDAGEYAYVLDGGARALHGRLRVEFLGDRTYLTVHAIGAPFRGLYTVKPGEVFVLGDNRSNSLDSRAWNEGRGGGVPVTSIEARANWFLVGTHRDGDPDLGRLLASVDSLQARVRLEGLDASPLDAGIARCLASRPKDTRPPPPGTL